MKKVKTLEEIRSIALMQFALESLIEDYEEAEYESDKYFTQLKFLDYVETSVVDLSVLLNYMDLQPEKFAPFIKMIENAKMEPLSKRKRAQKNQQRVKVYMYQ